MYTPSTSLVKSTGKTSPVGELMSELLQLLNILPESFSSRIPSDSLDCLVEFVLDLGRPFEVRYTDGNEIHEDLEVTHEILEASMNYLGEFGQDNRAGINRTLHRISKIVAKDGKTVVGLTCRAGRPIPGSVDVLKDFLDTGKSILLLGKPGIGKTSKLRSIAEYLSDYRRVVIVDTSSEIAGEGHIPHSAIGRARRLQVPFNKSQEDIMIEAVENHTPEVIIIDEISTVPEAKAARTIAQRGVQLIATAHGKTLSDFMQNPPLEELVGGINAVTLTDENAKANNGRKTKLERKTHPTFDVVVEIISYDEIHIHPDCTIAVDAILNPESEIPPTQQWRSVSGKQLYLNPHERNDREDTPRKRTISNRHPRDSKEVNSKKLRGRKRY